MLAIHPLALQAFYEPCEVEGTCKADGVAVVSVNGPLARKPDGFDDDYESISHRFEDALNDEDTRVVILKLDSPGGDAEGLNTTIDRMRASKKRAGKLVCSYTDDAAYSAAYALACVADEIYVPRGVGGVGSIGAITIITSEVEAYKRMGIDIRVVKSGKRKADGNPAAPITPAALRHIERHIGILAHRYFELVSESRGLSVQEIQAFEANTFYGDSAVKAGLADDVMGLDDVLRYARKFALSAAA